MKQQKSTDVQLMLSKSIQEYYGNGYLTYQKGVIENNDKLMADRFMITKFISESNFYGNLIDIGAGICQWFSLFEDIVNAYYAIDTNSISLSLAPRNQKLITLNENVFDNEFDLSKVSKVEFEYALFSFFLSHFSDSSIYKLINKLKSINFLIIIDSFWSNIRREKNISKELKEIKRKISNKNEIILLKRFFNYSDLERIGEQSGYRIINFKKGNYWFACIMQKDKYSE